MHYTPKPAARHADALSPGQLRHVIRVASITGRQPIRDVMLLWLTHSTGVRVTELASIELPYSGICLTYAMNKHRLHMPDICRRVYAYCINFQEW
jgi:site-specific recombinase XerD